MPTPLCTGLKSDHTPCRAVALAGYSLCFHHQRLHRRRRCRQRALRARVVRPGPLADRPAILRALTRVGRALAANTLIPVRAAAHIERIRLASDRLAR